MQGCPFCDQFKEMLKENDIEFYDRDINEYKEEYDIYSEVTKNDMVPAFMIIEGDETNYESFLYAPERNYNELTEALGIIQEHRKRLGII